MTNWVFDTSLLLLTLGVRLPFRVTSSKRLGYVTKFLFSSLSAGDANQYPYASFQFPVRFLHVRIFA